MNYFICDRFSVFPTKANGTWIPGLRAARSPGKTMTTIPLFPAKGLLQSLFTVFPAMGLAPLDPVHVFPAKGLAPQRRDPGRWNYHSMMPLRYSTWIPGHRATRSPGKTMIPGLRAARSPGKTKFTAPHTSRSPGKIKPTRLPRKTYTGHTLLEVLAVLTILAILSGIAINSIQHQLERHVLKQDTRLLLHTLETAKNLAIISQTPQQVLVNDQTITLNTTHYPLSNQSHITLARFPKSNTLSITFTSTGLTDCQNGTFTLSSPHGYQTQIIINQGGRLYQSKKP